jgi:regulatory protein
MAVSCGFDWSCDPANAPGGPDSHFRPRRVKMVGARLRTAHHLWYPDCAMAPLFHDTVAALEPVASPKGWVQIVLTTSKGPVLTESRCVELKVRVGLEWTEQVQVACIQGATIDRLKDRAAKAITRRARSRAQLRERLLRDGPDPALVEAALNELEAAGLIDDQAFARALVEFAAAKGPGRRFLLERKLVLAGVSHEIIAEVLSDQCPDPDTDARTLVEAKLAQAKVGESRATTAARIARLLASRGFDEHTALDAIEAVMGTIEDEDNPESFD